MGYYFDVDAKFLADAPSFVCQRDFEHFAREIFYCLELEVS
jgi:hypothetical protein